MKIRITDPNGVHFAGKILPKDSEHEIAKGPHTTAWLRFGQAEEIKAEGEKTATKPKNEAGGKPPKSGSSKKPREGEAGDPPSSDAPAGDGGEAPPAN